MKPWILIGIFLIAILLFAQIFRKKKKTEDTTETMNISLVDSNDRDYQPPATEEKTFTETKIATQHLKTVNHFGVTQSWYNDIYKLYRQGYNIYMNACTPAYQPCENSFRYYQNLYHRMIWASKLIEQAENSIGQKVLELHKLRFSDLTPEERKYVMTLQKNLPKIQSTFGKQRSAIWNAIHNIKNVVRQCGSSGQRWYARNRRNHIMKYGR